MESTPGALTPLDELYLERTFELAERARGNTSPNPLVGAVVVSGEAIVGEGYHHRAGEPHAETIALAQAGALGRGATLYVSLEPCRLAGRTPPCADAVFDAGVVRVVIGALDPTANGGGAEELRRRGLDVTIVHDPRAKTLIEPFAVAAGSDRVYVGLKMAMSLDGAVVSQPGVQEWLTSEATRRWVRELRIGYDAVMVGAGTIRTDDPQLTVRPSHHRLREYVRVVVCETGNLSAESRIFQREEGYAPTIVLVPAGFVQRFEHLRGVADVIGIGKARTRELDLHEALRVLHERGIVSLLCEGGPTLASRLIVAERVDRFYWAIAPCFLRGDRSVPVLASTGLLPSRLRLQFDSVERSGDDVVLSGTFERV